MGLLTYLPEDALILLPKVDEWIARLAMPDIGQSGLDTKPQVIADDFHTPAGPHVVVPSPRLPLSHQPEIHRRANQLPVECQIHPAHGEQSPLGNGQHGIHVASVALHWLDQLGGRVVVRDIEPKSVRHSCWLTLAHSKRITSDKVRAFGVRIVQRVEKVWRRRRQQVPDVLLECIDPLSGGLIGDEAVIIDGINILLLAHHVPKAAASRVFEADAPGLVPEDSLDVVSVIQLVVESLRNLNLSRRISVLNYDNVIRLERDGRMVQ